MMLPGNMSGAMISGQDSRSGGDEEKNKLSAAVSIPQRAFEWTGLSSDGENVLNDSVLWKLIAFTADDENYETLRFVSKQWKKTVDIQQPVEIYRMRRLMQQPIAPAPILNNPNEMAMRALALALVSLVDRDSNLYRKDENETSWPKLHPQYHADIKEFVGRVTMAEVSNALPYVMEPLAAYTMEEWKKEATLEKFLELWERWEFILDFCGSLSMEWHSLRVSGLPMHEFMGQFSVVESAKRELEIQQVVGFLASLKHSDTPYALLHKAAAAFETIRGFKAWGDNVDPRIQEAYDEFITSVEGKLEPTEQEEPPKTLTGKDGTVTIVTQDKTCFTLKFDSFFFQSSGLLKRMGLYDGDKINLKVNSNTLRTALEYYALIEAHPVADATNWVHSPGRNSSLNLGAGADIFQALVDEEDGDQLERLIGVAALLDLPRLHCTCMGLLASFFAVPVDP